MKLGMAAGWHRCAPGDRMTLCSCTMHCHSSSSSCQLACRPANAPRRSIHKNMAADAGTYRMPAASRAAAAGGRRQHTQHMAANRKSRPCRQVIQKASLQHTNESRQGPHMAAQHGATAASSWNLKQRAMPNKSGQTPSLPANTATHLAVMAGCEQVRAPQAMRNLAPPSTCCR